MGRGIGMGKGEVHGCLSNNALSFVVMPFNCSVGDKKLLKCRRVLFRELSNLPETSNFAMKTFPLFLV